MYEIFLDDNNKIIEKGQILYSNLKIKGLDMYLVIKKIMVTMMKMEKVLKNLENTN